MKKQQLDQTKTIINNLNNIIECSDIINSTIYEMEFENFEEWSKDNLNNETMINENLYLCCLELDRLLHNGEIELSYYNRFNDDYIIKTAKSFLDIKTFYINAFNLNEVK